MGVRQWEHLLARKPFMIKKGNEQQLLEFTDTPGCLSLPLIRVSHLLKRGCHWCWLSFLRHTASLLQVIYEKRSSDCTVSRNI